MADIELVIKIPEEIYKASQIIDVKHEDVIQIPLENIANGTPLDKIKAEIELNRNEWIKGKDAEWHTYDKCLLIIDKYTAEKE